MKKKDKCQEKMGVYEKKSGNLKKRLILLVQIYKIHSFSKPSNGKKII